MHYRQWYSWWKKATAEDKLQIPRDWLAAEPEAARAALLAVLSG